jgi:uncharacterized membrane protein
MEAYGVGLAFWQGGIGPLADWVAATFFRAWQGNDQSPKASI